MMGRPQMPPNMSPVYNQPQVKKEKS
jgi:hypothetical protein